MKIRTTLLVAALTVMAIAVWAQQTPKVTPSGKGYLEYLPPGYNGNSDLYPVVISLHGIVEKGTSSTDPALVLADLHKVDNVGLPKYVKSGGTQYPFIIISPQLKLSYSKWTGDFVMDVLDYVKTYLRVDTDRIYLTGLSLGGGGCWSVISDYPDVFAAVVPICSGYNVSSKACVIASGNSAIWAFHGDNDQTVSYTVTTGMVNAINNCSTPPDPLAQYTLFPGKGHIIWDIVYKETTALEWMQTFSKDGDGGDETEVNDLPTVSAGPDQTIALPKESLTLVGTASDPDGTIDSYLWTKTSGPAAGMDKINTNKLWAYDLVAGTYIFRLTVVDDDGASKYDEVKLTVNPEEEVSNEDPIVSAGPDQTIALPDDAITLIGSASDPDGTIESYLWTRTSGPAAGMDKITTNKLWAFDLVAGTYVFRLTVTDNLGATKYDEVTLTVGDDNELPIVSAGGDQTVVLPDDAITLVGSASDPDGTIATYSWTKTSGPAVGMDKITTNKLWAYDLVAGTYIFRLTVKDNDGAAKYDEVKLTVN